MDSKPPKCADYVDAVTKEPVFIVHAFSKTFFSYLKDFEAQHCGQ